MQVACPECGSRYLKLTRSRSFREKLREFWGICPLRCGDCDTRFVARTWSLAPVTHARCPKCLRMDLSTWSEEHFEPTTWMLLCMNLGARPYRCEYCRLNFVSFRRRKEKFTFRRWRQMAEAKARAAVNRQ